MMLYFSPLCMVIGDLSHMSYLWVCISGCLSVFLYFCLSVYFFVLSLVICGRCLLWMSVQFGGRPWLLCGCLFLCVSVCMFFLYTCLSVFLVVCFFLYFCLSVPLFVWSLVICHTCLLWMSHQLGGRPWPRLPSGSAPRHKTSSDMAKPGLVNSLLECEKYRVILFRQIPAVSRTKTKEHHQKST